MNATLKNIDLLEREDLDSLLAPSEGLCVSILLPADASNKAEPNEPALRLKNLLGTARRRLEAEGLRAPEADAILADATQLVSDRFFWQQQREGLALFLRPGAFAAYRLPLAFRETAAVSCLFLIKPILPLMTDDGRFCILSLNLGGIRLHQCSRFTCEEIDLGEIPRSLEDITRTMDFERSEQHHTGKAPQSGQGRPPGFFHGHGGSADDANQQELVGHLLRSVNKAITDRLSPSQTPLVLAGGEHLRGMFRDITHYSGIVPAGVDGNPEDMNAAELQQRAWGCVAPLFAKGRKSAEERYLHLAGNDDARAVSSLGEIVAAAWASRIDTLFIPIDGEDWGVFDSANQDTRVCDEWAPGRQDLVNAAAVYTLRNGGGVFDYPTGAEVPGDGNLAAVLRF